MSADWSCTCKQRCVNTWGDTLWNQPWSYTASQNSLAEGFLLKTTFFEEKKRGGDLLIEKKIVWTFLIKNPWGNSVKRHFPTSQNRHDTAAVLFP